MTQRATGKTATSISMSEETLKQAKAAAEADGRTLSNWLEQLIRNAVKMVIISLLLHSAYAFTQRPDMSQRGIERAVSVGAKMMHRNVLALIRDIRSA